MRLYLTIFFFLLLTTPVFGIIGLSHEPLDNRELRLPAGDQYLFKITFQNTYEEAVRANISLKSDIATLIGPQLATIPSQSIDKFIILNISVPQDAEVGDRYTLRYIITPQAQEEGQVPLSFRYDRTITVVIVEGEPQQRTMALDNLLTSEPIKKSSFWREAGLLIVLVLIIASLFMLSKKREGMRKTIRAKNSFKFSNGVETYTLRELSTLIENHQVDAKKHLREGTNDFGVWIEHEFKNPTLAQKVRKAKTVEEITKVLRNA